MVKKVFTVGDLVFAKVKGYPAWPARVTGRTSGGKYCVFFYGTFEVGNMKPEEMWPYNQKFRDRFGPPNMRKKWYPEGLYQIEHTPEIALQPLGLVGEQEIVQGGGDLPAPPEPVLVKILSSNQVKEISVKQDHLGDNQKQASPKPKVQCEIGTAEKIFEAADSILDTEITKELKKKVNVVKMDTKDRVLLMKIEKLEWLKLEQRLVDIVCEIQRSMSQSSPDLVKCVEMLKLMEEVDIKPLMVIKLPEVFMTVRRLSMEWIAGGGAGDGCLAEQVRERSERLREKIVQVVNLGKPISLQEFNEVLEKKVKEFKLKTSGMSEKKRLGIINLDDV